MRSKDRTMGWRSGAETVGRRSGAETVGHRSGEVRRRGNEWSVGQVAGELTVGWRLGEVGRNEWSVGARALKLCIISACPFTIDLRRLTIVSSVENKHINTCIHVHCTCMYVKVYLFIHSMSISSKKSVRKTLYIHVSDLVFGLTATFLLVQRRVLPRETWVTYQKKYYYVEEVM